MNKKFSSLVASTVHHHQDLEGAGGSDIMAGMSTPGSVQVVKFKKLKIKQQKIKDHKKGSGSGSSDHSKPSGFTSLFLPSSGATIQSSPGHHAINPLEQLRKDMLLSSLLYSLNQSILTIPCPLPPFLLPDHFKSFLKFSLKSSSSQSLIPSFQLLCAASSPLAIADAASSPSQDLNLSPPPTNQPAFDLSATMVTSSDDMVTINLNLPTSFKIKEYAPIVFASLRDKVFSFGTKTLYKQSLFHPVKGPPIKYTPQVVQATSSDSHGHHGHDKSSASPVVVNRKLLYTSSDNLLHIKGIDGQEVEQLLSLLRSLHPYLVQRKSNITKVTRDVTGGPGPSCQSIVNSLLPQYMAIYRLSYPQHIHSLSSVVSSVSSAASSASKGIKGSTSSESHTYLLILRNPLSSERTFFPIHHTYHLTADGIKHVYGSRTGTSGQQATGQSTENNDFTLILKKEDADKLLSNLESDLKFLAAHLLVNYTLLIGVHSIDLWEQQLQEEAEDDEELFVEEDEDDQGSLVQTITQQLKGLKSGEQVSPEPGKKSDTSDSGRKEFVTKRLSNARKESLSLVIDPVRHPFAIPSPFVSVDSRTSSRPSLYSSEGQSSDQVSTMDSTEGRFVYFIGFDDLIPLSASFSSKELNIEKVLSEKKKDKKEAEGKKDKKDDGSGHKAMAHSDGGGGGGGHQDKENVGDMAKKDDQEMGKKEAAREYSKHMMAQVRKRLKVIHC